MRCHFLNISFVCIGSKMISDFSLIHTSKVVLCPPIGKITYIAICNLLYFHFVSTHYYALVLATEDFNSYQKFHNLN